MRFQKIIILNDKKEKLVGYLREGTTKILIIVCHGLESNNHPSEPFFQELIPKYFEELCHKTGANIFSFDFSGYGESEGRHFVSFKQRDKDLSAVIDYFVTRHDYERIILYGFSLGGASVAIAASNRSNIHGVIAINGFFTLSPKNLYKANMLLILSYLVANPLYVSELYYLTKNIKAEKIAVPTLVIHSDNDHIVKVTQSKKFYNKLRTMKKFVPIQSNDHMMAKEYKRLPIEISAWLKGTFAK